MASANQKSSTKKKTGGKSSSGAKKPAEVTQKPPVRREVGGLVLWLLAGKAKRPYLMQSDGVLVAALLKFGVLYGLVVKVICGVASGALLGQKIGQTVVLAPPMLEKLPAMFTWPQLITALIGGAVALPVTAALRRGLKR